MPLIQRNASVAACARLALVMSIENVGVLRRVVREVRGEASRSTVLTGY